MSISGIYELQFSSDFGYHGKGIIVLDNGVFNGGDTGFSFKGTYDVQGEQLRARFKAKRYSTVGLSIFKTQEDFELMLSGDVDLDLFTFHLSGSEPSQGVEVYVLGRRIDKLQK